MKKTIILSLILLGFGVGANANPAFNPSIINDIQTFQGTSMHDLNSIKQQRFRYEEMNEVKDIKEQKEKRNRKNQTDVLFDSSKKHNNVVPTTQDFKFVEEDGQIKIEGDNVQQ